MDPPSATAVAPSPPPKPAELAREEEEREKREKEDLGMKSEETAVSEKKNTTITTPDSEEKIFYEPVEASSSSMSPPLGVADLSGSVGTQQQRQGVGIGGEKGVDDNNDSDAKKSTPPTSTPTPPLPKRQMSQTLPEAVIQEPNSADLPEAVVIASVDTDTNKETTTKDEPPPPPLPKRPRKGQGQEQEGGAQDTGSLPEYQRRQQQTQEEKQACYQPNTDPMTMCPTTKEAATVTPLRLLGDQSDEVDCPFCRRRVETRVTKTPSAKTHTVGAVLCFTTLFGALLPCWCGWYYDVDHRCGNCDRVVARRRHGNKGEMEVYGTPEHLKEVSKYPPAAPVSVSPGPQASVSGLGFPCPPAAAAVSPVSPVSTPAAAVPASVSKEVGVDGG